MISAVLDRIVDEKLAVLLVEEYEEEFILPLQCIPHHAQEGTWLLIKRGDQDVSIQIDHERSAATFKRLTNKLDQLRSKQTSSKFKI